MSSLRFVTPVSEEFNNSFPKDSDKKQARKMDPPTAVFAADVIIIDTWYYEMGF